LKISPLLILSLVSVCVSLSAQAQSTSCDTFVKSLRECIKTDDSEFQPLVSSLFACYDHETSLNQVALSNSLLKLSTELIQLDRDADAELLYDPLFARLKSARFYHEGALEQLRKLEDCLRSKGMLIELVKVLGTAVAVEQKSSKPRSELFGLRESYCESLYIASDSTSERRERTKLLADEESEFGQGSPKTEKALVPLINCYLKANMKEYLSLVPRLQIIVSQSDPRGYAGCNEVGDVVTKLLDDDQYDRAYSLSLAAIDNFTKVEDRHLLSETLENTATKLAANGRQAQADALYEHWMQGIQKAEGRSSMITIAANLDAAEFFAKTKRFDRAIALTDGAIDFMTANVSHGEQYLRDCTPPVDSLIEQNQLAQAIRLYERYIPIVEAHHRQDYALDLKVELAETYFKEGNSLKARRIIEKVAEDTIATIKSRHDMVENKELQTYINELVALGISKNEYQIVGGFLGSFRLPSERLTLQLEIAEWYQHFNDYVTASALYENSIKLAQQTGKDYGQDFASWLHAYASCLTAQNLTNRANDVLRWRNEIQLKSGYVDAKGGSGPLPNLETEVYPATKLLTAQLRENWQKSGARPQDQVTVAFRIDLAGHLLFVNVTKSSGSNKVDELARACVKNIDSRIQLKCILLDADFECTFKDNDALVSSTCIAPGRLLPTDPGDEGPLNEYYWRIKGELRELSDQIKFTQQPHSKFIEGTIIVQFELNKRGDILNVKVLHSSGLQERDEHVVKNLKERLSFGPLPWTAPSVIVVQFFIGVSWYRSIRPQIREVKVGSTNQL